MLKSPCEVAQAQLQVVSLLVQAEQLKEYSADWLKNINKVTRDGSGRFASKASGNTSRFGIPKQTLDLFGLKLEQIQSQVELTKDQAIKALDRVKTQLGELEKTKEVKQAEEIASKVLTDGIPALTYMATTFGPDVAIGLALGESLPIILGGAAAMALASKLAEAQLKELDLDNTWIKAGVNLGISLLTADLVKGIAASIKGAKFGAQGVYQIIEAGKTADDLKATFKAVRGELEELGKPAKSALEQTRHERFIHSLTLSTQITANKPIGKFFEDLAVYAGGFIKNPGDNLVDYVEKELKGLNTSLIEAGVEPRAFSKRLAELSDFSDVPVLHRWKRISHIKRLIQRAGEIPQALKNVKSPELKEIENEILVLSKEFNDRLNSGEDVHQLLQDPKWLEAMLKTDRGNELQFGAQWRATLLNAEIKHGKNLDSFVHSVTGESAALQKRYEAFLGSLVKDKPRKSDFSFASDEEFLKYKPQNAEHGDDHWQPWASKPIRDAVAKECIKAAELFGRLSPVKLKVKLGSLGSRGFQVANLINVSDGNRTILWHELTHIVEQSLEDGFDFSSAFRHARTTKPGLDDMARLRMPGEKAIFDNFYHPYTGKVYAGGTTEILTTGVEKLATAEGLHFLGTVDREHLMFVLGMLDG